MRKTNQTQATMPKSHEEKAGVRCRRLIDASRGGPALCEPIDSIERAVEKRLVLTLDYRDEAGRGSARDVRPLGLWFWGKVWTLIAWCEMREDFRTFRIDRIASVASSGRTFKPERGRQLADFYRTMERGENMGTLHGRANGS